MTIRELILSIVDSHSGGIKFIELMTEFLVSVHGEVTSPEYLEHEIESIPELGILRYAYEVNPNDLYREKMFVYRKFPDEVCKKGE